MRRIALFALTLTAVLCYLAGPAAAQRKARTDDGKEVLLFDDGTWRWAAQLSLARVPVEVLAAPPFSGRLAGGAKARLTRLRLRKVSARRNKITDDGAWFRNNGLALSRYEVPNAFRRRKGNVPDRTPTAYRGNKLVSAIRAPGALFLVYGRDFSSGRYLVIAGPKAESATRVLDFGAYTSGGKDKPSDRSFVYQQVNWVAEADGVLYVSTGHRTYAASSGGRNAYITALDASTFKLRWRSKPLVCNAQNFEIVDDAIICGYGFTDEPDHLLVLDRGSGKVVQRIKLKTGPSYILRKGDQIFVRTYNMDYVFGFRGRGKKQQ